MPLILSGNYQTSFFVLSKKLENFNNNNTSAVEYGSYPHWQPTSKSGFESEDRHMKVIKR